MRAKVPLPARQVALFPKARSEEEAKVEDLQPELIDALADLLLEALGDDVNAEGSGLESQDHA
jgi:hypothetical protein